MAGAGAFSVVIPARYGSTRFPGKPLAMLGGRPMILHTCDRARESGARRIIVATDHDDVLEVCAREGVEALLTRKDHESGTDRLAEVTRRLALPARHIVVNLQGDEPLMPPDFIRRVAVTLSGEQTAPVATLITPLRHPHELHDANVVKAICDKQGYALYFSRAPVPWDRQQGGRPREVEGWFRHLGIYAYRAAFLRRFPDLAVPQLERKESLEQLRVLWHGERILTTVVHGDRGPGIDTPEQLAEAEEQLSGKINDPPPSDGASESH